MRRLNLNFKSIEILPGLGREIIILCHPYAVQDFSGEFLFQFPCFSRLGFFLKVKEWIGTWANSFMCFQQLFSVWFLDVHCYTFSQNPLILKVRLSLFCWTGNLLYFMLVDVCAFFLLFWYLMCIGFASLPYLTFVVCLNFFRTRSPIWYPSWLGGFTYCLTIHEPCGLWVSVQLLLPLTLRIVAFLG